MTCFSLRTAERQREQWAIQQQRIAVTARAQLLQLFKQHQHVHFESTQQQIYKHSMKKQRELVEAKLGRALDDKVWHLVEKKQRSQQLAAKNELRTKRRIANAKNERKRLILKQNNLATCDVRQAIPTAVSKQRHN